MPFSVFRTHQKKLLVIVGILAMIGFILGDTRWWNGGGRTANDSVIADLDSRPVRISDLAQMKQERLVANRFMGLAIPYGSQGNFFGGTTRAELLDALILKREADRLNIPETAEFAKEWIKRSNPGMNPSYFESIRSRFENMSGEELLIDVARQARILMAKEELAMPMITPLDVYQNYRDQTERASFKVVPFAVDQYLKEVGEPTELDVVTLYDKYKDVLPDPASPSPGFKVPRKVSVEYLSVNAYDLAKTIKDKLPEDEIKAYYETRRTEFPLDLGLPVDLFMGEPKLTPPRYQPYSVQRDLMANALSLDKAKEQIQLNFDKISESVIDTYADKYKLYQDEVNDRKKDGRKYDDLTPPRFEDLVQIAKKYDLKQEITPLLDRKEAERYSGISGARTGTGQSRDGRSFVTLFFDSRTPLYDRFELTDILGGYYLVRKLSDEKAHIANLEDVRSQVVRAWKMEKARPIARKAAEDYAAKLKAEGGVIKALTVDNHPVIAIESATKLKAGQAIPPELMMQFRSMRMPATPAQLYQIPNAGQALLDALFALKAGQVAVEADQPQTSYYAMALERREPVSYASVMGPNGALTTYWSETYMDRSAKGYTEAMVRLREKAGLRMTVLADEPERGEETPD